MSRELHVISSYQTEIQETRVVHLRWGKKILEFYKAPVTKFWSNVVSSAAFLLLFTSSKGQLFLYVLILLCSFQY